MGYNMKRDVAAVKILVNEDAHYTSVELSNINSTDVFQY